MKIAMAASHVTKHGAPVKPVAKSHCDVCHVKPECIGVRRRHNVGGRIEGIAQLFNNLEDAIKAAVALPDIRIPVPPEDFIGKIIRQFIRQFATLGNSWQ
jgi:hypothetical protein